eukprot:5316338-Prymnesium_polylepis.1
MTQVHKDNLASLSTADTNKADLQVAIAEYQGVVKEQHGEEARVIMLVRIDQETQVARAECLEEFLKAGVEVAKVDKLRAYLERRMGVALTETKNLMSTYLPPLKLKEEKILKSEFKGEFVGCYHDGTTQNGESFCIVFRACKPAGLHLSRLLCARALPSRLHDRRPDLG